MPCIMAYPKLAMPMMGFIMCKALQLPSRDCGYETIGRGVKIDIVGGQDGEVNVPWDMWVSSPKLRLLWKNGSFGISLGELYSALWSVSWCEV